MCADCSRLSALLSRVEPMRSMSGSDAWIQRLQDLTRRKRLFVSTTANCCLDKNKIVAAEGDLVEFSKITSHFSSEQPESKEIFKPDKRPDAVRRLYQEAAEKMTDGKVLYLNCESCKNLDYQILLFSHFFPKT